MIQKIVIFILIFYILALVQSSFLVHFTIKGMVPNLILISVILISFLEKPGNYLGFIAAVSGGFFLDIFSSRLIGFEILILLLITLFIKMILKKYLQPIIPLGSRP